MIDDYKAVVDDLVMTGQDLMAISTRQDAAGVQKNIDLVTTKYSRVKQTIRDKLGTLDEAIQKLSVDVSLFYLN